MTLESPLRLIERLHERLREQYRYRRPGRLSEADWRYLITRPDESKPAPRPGGPGTTFGSWLLNLATTAERFEP